MGQQVVCIDFDDTIATYGGWHDEGFVAITGVPKPGAVEAIAELRRHYIVFVHSVRCGYPGGNAAIVAWLERYGIVVDGVSVNKPRADLYVDDRGCRYTGDWGPAFVQQVHELIKVPAREPGLAPAPAADDMCHCALELVTSTGNQKCSCCSGTVMPPVERWGRKTAEDYIAAVSGKPDDLLPLLESFIEWNKSQAGTK